MINSVAGGGTLLTYPTLFYVIKLDAIVANTTNTMALWPASLAGAWGFRTHAPQSRALVLSFSVASALGGITGAILLKHTQAKQFEAIVPWLILMAAVLFLAQERIVGALSEATSADADHPAADNNPGETRANLPISALIFQFAVGIYGGYFGAGIGIIMLGALSMLKLGDIYQLSFLKNLGALCINVAATVLFSAWGLVDWRYAVVMAVSAMLGGYAGAGFAKKIGARRLRMAVSIVGFAIEARMLIQQLQ